IGSPDPAFRFATLRIIGRLFEKRPDDGVIDESLGDAVISALNDNDRAIRATAMQALGAMRYERGVEALTGLYRYFGKGDLAETALDSLARIAHPESAGLFSSLLNARNPAFKEIAIEGLARIGDRSKFADIQTALGVEPNQSLQLAGQFAAVRLSSGSLDQLAEALSRPQLHDQARQYLIELASGRAGWFARYVQDPDSRMRADVADILGLCADAAALPIVEQMMNDPDQQVALAAQRAVARLRAARATS